MNSQAVKWCGPCKKGRKTLRKMALCYYCYVKGIIHYYYYLFLLCRNQR